MTYFANSRGLQVYVINWCYVLDDLSTFPILLPSARALSTSTCVAGNGPADGNDTLFEASSSYGDEDLILYNGSTPGG